MFISLNGLIGVGKSTIAKILRTLGYNVIEEPVDEWTEWLTNFYNNKKKYAFGLQLKILLSQMYINNENELLITERDVYTSKNIFCKMLYEDGLIENIEKKLYDEYVSNFTQIPDIIFYYKAPVNICMERIKKRNRKSEENINEEYITRLYNMHEDALQKKSNVFIIDSRQNIEDVLKDTLQLIKINKKI